MPSSSSSPLEFYLTRHDENNFDFIRPLASLMVLFGHSFQWIDIDPFYTASNGLVTAASLGLNMFFFLSGLLIAQSLRTCSSWKDFLIRRVLRIYPAPVAAILFFALIAGPLLTVLPLKDYFLHPEFYKFLGGINVFRVYYTLPGVLRYHGQDLSLISSFWSLSLELKLYLMLLLGWLINIRYKRAIVLFLIGAVLFFNLFFYDKTTYVFSHLIPVSFNPFSYTVMGLLFLMGAACNIFRKEIYVRRYWIMILLPLLALTIFYKLFFVMTFILTPAGLLYLGTHGRRWIRYLTPRADLSYGIYIYGAAVGKVVFLYLHPGNGWVTFFIALAGVLPLAFLSWYCVEKPALAYKKKLSALLRVNGRSPSFENSWIRGRR
jgi:peptidoglycan/LPS O-acetylase OafA/YrhL